LRDSWLTAQYVWDDHLSHTVHWHVNNFRATRAARAAKRDQQHQASAQELEPIAMANTPIQAASTAIDTDHHGHGHAGQATLRNRHHTSGTFNDTNTDWASQYELQNDTAGGSTSTLRAGPFTDPEVNGGEGVSEVSSHHGPAPDSNPWSHPRLTDSLIDTCPPFPGGSSIFFAQPANLVEHSESLIDDITEHNEVLFDYASPDVQSARSTMTFSTLHSSSLSTLDTLEDGISTPRLSSVHSSQLATLYSGSPVTTSVSPAVSVVSPGPSEAFSFLSLSRGNSARASPALLPVDQPLTGVVEQEGQPCNQNQSPTMSEWTDAESESSINSLQSSLTLNSPNVAVQSLANPEYGGLGLSMGGLSAGHIS
jgi:hypothetical protein